MYAVVVHVWPYYLILPLGLYTWHYISFKQFSTIWLLWFMRVTSCYLILVHHLLVANNHIHRVKNCWYYHIDGSAWFSSSENLVIHRCILFYWYLVSRRQTYSIGHSSGIGLSMFSARESPVRERVDDGYVGAIDISRFRCPGLSGLKNTARLAVLVETVDVGVLLCRV
jgi:hypothetical protein